jgi:hypothetical protein
MSDKPIWSLWTKRSELGGATKGQIYLSKMGLGFACWFVLWLASVGSFYHTVVGCAAVFVTSKICWYAFAGELPDSWHSVADWCCDGALHFSWCCVWWLWTGNYTGSAVIAGLWLCTYPWSSE